MCNMYLLSLIRVVIIKYNPSVSYWYVLICSNKIYTGNVCTYI